MRVRATVPVEGGRAAAAGDLAIAGVPGTGPAITTDYLDPGGSVLGSVLPTGKACDRIDAGGYGVVEASIVDVTSPHAFVRAADVDVDDLRQLEAVRAACGAAVGLDSLAVPRLAIVGPPAEGSDGAHIEGRATSMQRLHHAFPMTGALCTAAAALIPGTIASEVSLHHPPRSRELTAQVAVNSRKNAGPALDEGAAPTTIRLRHPKGVVEVRAEVDGETVRSVGVTRTARRLLRGEAFVVLR